MLGQTTPPVPTFDWGWVLSSQGLAVTLVLIGVTFLIGVATWYGPPVFRWVGERIDVIVDGHVSFLTTTKAQAERSTTALEGLNDSLRADGEAHERTHWAILRSTQIVEEFASGHPREREIKEHTREIRRGLEE